MRTRNEEAIIRHRQQSLSESADTNQGTAFLCAPAMVFKTFQEFVYPVVPGSYFACRTVRVGGPEVEGGAITEDVVTNSKTYVANIGSVVPPVGTKMVGTWAGGRWEMRYDG